MKIIMGIDPGLEKTGYGILDVQDSHQRLISSGCIITTRIESIESRLFKIFNRCLELFKEFKPESVALESLFFSKNVKTAINVGQARGVILLTCGLHNIPVFSYAPLEVKLAVTGYGKAGKKQVQEMVKSILHLHEVLKPDDTADAVAVALTHCFSHKLKMKG